MYRRSSSGQLLEILLFTLSSLLLYHTGVGFVLFLVPLQIVASRRGFASLALAEGVFLAVFLGIRFWPTLAETPHAMPDVLTSMEMGVAAVCLIGMLVVNLPLRRRPRNLLMLLAATAVAGAAAVPAALLLAGTPAFQQAMSQLFTQVSRMMTEVLPPAGDSGSNAFFSQMLQPDRLRRMTEATLLRSLAADYLVLLSFAWWAGQAAARRAPAYGARSGFRLSAFRLEAGWLWPLIASGALVLADLFFGDSPSFAFFRAVGGPYVAWNVGLVLLFLFGLQGMAIVMFLFEKYHVPRVLWLLLVAGLFVLAASPGAGLFIVLLVPVLGISENWIRYRIPPEAAPTE
jgi:hypothetical protein